MNSRSLITFYSIILLATSCSDPKAKNDHGTSKAEADWNKSELLSKLVKLRDNMSREEVSEIMGVELYDPCEHGPGCISLMYVEKPDSFIGRVWVSGGPHSWTGLTASFIDGQLVYISFNPGYVDQDRLDAYYLADPIDNNGTDLRGRYRWELFQETSSARTKRQEGEKAAPSKR